MNLSTAELAAAVDGRLLAQGRPVRGVSTDTRTLRPGDVFFALRPTEDEPGGADGHAYVADAARRGAAAAVICAPAEDLPEGFGVVQVDDSLLALGRLASMWRRRMPARVAVVAGSVGKTSTKAMIGSILSPIAPTVVAERSFNNEIGVPLTIFELDRSRRFCVLELAMRGPGEIEYLARIAHPEVAAITNIGSSHIGRLGSREAIADAKGEVLPLLPRTGTAVLNRDDAFFDVLRARSEAPVLSFGLSEEADIRAEGIDDLGLDGAIFTCRVGERRQRISLRVPGAHFVSNALAAAAVAHALGVDLPAIAEGLGAYEGAEMRARVVRSPKGFTVISDCYNAAPTSVEAALRLLASTPGRRIFVFGDMAELGDEGPRAHREVGVRAAKLGVARLLTIGELAKLAGEAAEEQGVDVANLPGPAEAVAALEGDLQPGDTVLVKASRVMHLEDVVEGLVPDA